MPFPPPTPRQARTIWFSVTTFAVALSLALLALLLFGLGRLINLLSPVLWPLAVATVLAYLLSPVVHWLVDRKIPRARAVLLVFVVMTVLVLGALGSVVPRILMEARDLATQVPNYAAKARTRIERWIEHPPASLLRFIPVEWQQRFESLKDSLPGAHTNAATKPSEPARSEPSPIPAEPSPSVAPSAAGDTNSAAASPAGAPESPAWMRALDPRALKSVGTWVATVAPDLVHWGLGKLGRVAAWIGLLAGLFLVPVYAFFFLLEEPRIAKSWTDYLPVADPNVKSEVVFVLRSINEALIVFFRGQVLVALCDGVLYAVGFALIGLPYALLLGAMASIVTIIPFLGAALTCGTALIVALVQGEGWQLPLLVVAVFSVVQTIEGFVLQPRIIGDRVGLHPLTVIIALMVGTSLLGGILGGLLAIPLTATLGVVMGRYVWKSPGKPVRS
ncbi:MAG: AI-2E family transporter [Verrucomicrobia bacterium]|nr:AI-2E family transporter [Verrucomicrobiota bacterium]